jgi:ABC-type transporter MlaC component
MTENHYGASKKLWTALSEKERALFNLVFEEICSENWGNTLYDYKGPSSQYDEVDIKFFTPKQCMAFNAAWIAAEKAMEIRKNG